MTKTLNRDLAETEWQPDWETLQTVGLLLSAGTIGSIILLISGNKKLFSWFTTIGLINVGIGVLLLALYLKDRERRIKRTGDQIIAELHKLDPIARAEVVKYIVETELVNLPA